MNEAHSTGFVLLLLGVSAFLAWLVYFLFALYRENRPPIARRFQSLELEPDQLGGFGYGQLALVSLLSLFLEMMIIRWISSEIRVFAYFKNLVLVACFLGFGLGCHLCRRRIQLLAMLAPLLTLTVILKTPLSPLHEVVVALPRMLGGSTDVQMWGVPTLPTSWSDTFLALAVMVPLFAVLAMVFVPTGQLVGWYLEHAGNGVRAYSVNVLASLAGIGTYTLLCFLYQPPAIWMLVAGAVAVVVFWRKRSAAVILAAAFLASVLLLRIPDSDSATTYWSPYQKLDLRPNYENNTVVSYTLHTNDSWYQQIVDLSDQFFQAHPDDANLRPVELRAYNIPYQFYRAPPAVLVLGAGMGNDVAAALRNGAGRVVAVEIDPLILKLGRNLHFEHPYQSPKTQVVVDDARSYIENSHDQFDLIVFSLLDSHTTSSTFSNIRIDNFVYTREAFESARKLLKPDGIFVVKFGVNTPWIVGRLAALMKTTFASDPIQCLVRTIKGDTGGIFFISGSASRLAQAMTQPELAALVHDTGDLESEPARLTTDDWPYFYQREPGLPAGVILISLATLLTFGWFLRQSGPREGTSRGHFFLLGAGFMLLEAQIVSRMALLFGTTWMVNSIVVSGLLCLIVAANFVFQRLPRIPIAGVYGALFVSLLVSLLVPNKSLFFESVFLRAIVGGAVLCLPVFFAGIIFVSSFARARFQGSALGANLFGSLAGGLLESLSLWFGLSSLVALAVLIYAASAWALRRGPDLATAAQVGAPAPG